MRNLTIQEIYNETSVLSLIQILNLSEFQKELIYSQTSVKVENFLNATDEKTAFSKLNELITNMSGITGMVNLELFFSKFREIMSCLTKEQQVIIVRLITLIYNAKPI